MISHKVEFPGSLGHLLAARLDQPNTLPRAWAVFAHCFTCSKDSKAAAYIARALVEAGFGVLRFDFTGLGGSGGDFANTHFSSNVGDLVSAADWLRSEHGAPALLIGHSLGGAAVLAAAHRIADARAVVTLGAPFEPAHVVHHFGEGLALIETDGEARVTLAGREFTLRREFLDDVASQPQAERIRALRRPLLVLHAPGDTIVGVDNARRIFEQALHPKSFVSLDDADHLLNSQGDAAYAAGLIAAWAKRYLPAPAPSSPVASTPAAGPLPVGAVRISDLPGNFAVNVEAGRHTLVSDEPVEVGGDDLGMGPYDLLLGGLGACTAMTLRLYARHKKCPLSRTFDLHRTDANPYLTRV
jgi:putative redox protein